MILAWLACTTTYTVQATEAFDIPPPPDARTLRLTGAHPPVQLGQMVTLRAGATTVQGDVVDATDDPPELVVYVPEGPAQDLLDAVTLTVR